MLMPPSVTVIVAVYNKIQSLPKTFASLWAQTFQDFEVICVDDGSEDGSAQWCKQQEALHPQLRLVRQPHKGVSAARQAGLEAAKGNYVVHVDPDDWVDPSFLHRMLEKAQNEGADMVMCGVWTEYPDCCKPTQTYEDRLYVAPDLLHALVAQRTHGSVCNKLVRTTLARQTGFHPQTLVCFEDALFLMRLLHVEPTLKICGLAACLYHYVVRPSSLTNFISPHIYQAKRQLLHEIEQFLPAEQYDGFYAIKRTVLHWAFVTKQKTDLQCLFPEVQRQVRKEGKWNDKLAVVLTLLHWGVPFAWVHGLYSLLYRK